MNGGEFPEQSPAWAVGSKHQILVVISYIFRAGVRWPAAEIRVMNLQELFAHRGQRRHHDVDEAEAEVHQRAVDAAKAAREWCGTGPMCGKFPTMGHGLGPGGSGREVRVMNFIIRYMRIAAANVAKANYQWRHG